MKRVLALCLTASLFLLLSVAAGCGKKAAKQPAAVPKPAAPATGTVMTPGAPPPATAPAQPPAVPTAPGTSPAATPPSVPVGPPVGPPGAAHYMPTSPTGKGEVPSALGTIPPGSDTSGK